MNPELYNDEFRSFKLLKLSSEFAAYFRMVGNLVNSVQPGLEANSPTFEWPYRVEFVEQLLDLTDDTLYIVDTSGLEQTQNFYEDAVLRIVEKPILYEGNMFMPDLGTILTEEDVDKIENNWADILMCPGAYRDNFEVHIQADAVKNIIDVKSLPIVPKKNIGYTTLFADLYWAELYRTTVTRALRNKKASISAITRLF